MLRVKRIAGVRGFMPTTWAVFDGDCLVRLFTKKYEAELFAKDINEHPEWLKREP